MWTKLYSAWIYESWASTFLVFWSSQLAKRVLQRKKILSPWHTWFLWIVVNKKIPQIPPTNRPLVLYQTTIAKSFWSIPKFQDFAIRNNYCGFRQQLSSDMALWVFAKNHAENILMQLSGIHVLNLEDKGEKM